MPIPFGHRSVSRQDGSTPDAWFGYACAHCGRQVSGAVLAQTADERGRALRWLQCSVCFDASVMAVDGTIYPAALFGPNIEGLPDDVASAYEEARRCLAVNANAAAEGVCRRILMHVAADKGAEEGQSFASYIDFLAEKGYVTPPMRGWVKLIKDHGNTSQHRLKKPDRKRAEGTLLFTAQLLRSVYEMEHLASQFVPQPSETGPTTSS